MKSFTKILILTFSLLITTSCDTPNALTEYSKQDSDEALFLEAQKRIDDKNWDSAISILTTEVSTDFRQQTRVKERLMHAYGGKCGISFLELIDSLKSVSSTKIFEIALQLYAGKVVDITACDNAIATLLQIGPTAVQRTNRQNSFAAILGLTRMAVTLHEKMDQESSGLGDGVPDVGWNSCTPANNANHLSDADINRIATGIGLIFENLSFLAGDLTSGSAGSTFDAAKTLCETPLPPIGQPSDYPGGSGSWADYGLPNPPSYADLGLPADTGDPLNCVNTVDSAVTTKMRKIVRRMVASKEMGFGGTMGCELLKAEIEMTGSNPPIKLTMNCCPALDGP